MKTKDAKALLCSCCRRPLPADMFRLRTRRNEKGYICTYREQPCRACRNAGERRRYIAITWIRRCLTCGNVYLGKAYSKYCSNKCNWTARHKRNYVPRQLKMFSKREVVPCIKCGSLGSKYARRSICKECDKAKARARRERRKIENPAAHEASLAKLREYKEKHPRTVKKERLRPGAIDDFSAEDWQTVMAAFNWSCAYCGDRGGDLQKDHVVPVSAGGDNTLTNIVPACKKCNGHNGKWAQDMRDWLNDECLYESVLMGIGDAEWLQETYIKGNYAPSVRICAPADVNTSN